MEKTHEELDEIDELEKQTQHTGDKDETPNEVLKADMEDEFEEPVEPTADDLEVEEEMKLTGNEEKWLQDLNLRAKEWKASRSTYPHEAQAAIGKIHAEDFSQEDIRLYHAFKQVQKSSSQFFQQKFGRILRKQIRDTKHDTESTGYQLTKILGSLSNAEQE